MHFRGALSQYTKTMKNCIHHSSYVIVLNILLLIVFLVHESWQLINERSGMKPPEQGAIKGSCIKEGLRNDKIIFIIYSLELQ